MFSIATVREVVGVPAASADVRCLGGIGCDHPDVVLGTVGQASEVWLVAVWVVWETSVALSQESAASFHWIR